MDWISRTRSALKMNFDKAFIAHCEQAVALNIFCYVIKNFILGKISALDQQLGVKFEFKHIVPFCRNNPAAQNLNITFFITQFGTFGASSMFLRFGTECAASPQCLFFRYRPYLSANNQVRFSNCVPHFEHVTRILPLPRGARRRWRHFGHVKYRYCLCLLKKFLIRLNSFAKKLPIDADTRS